MPFIAVRVVEELELSQSAKEQILLCEIFFLTFLLCWNGFALLKANLLIASSEDVLCLQHEAQISNISIVYIVFFFRDLFLQLLGLYTEHNT